jgi:hypothetical protein
MDSLPAGGACRKEAPVVASFELGQTAKITCVVAGHVPGTDRVIVWIRGCSVPCHIRPAGKVEVGDTLELDAEIVGVGKRALALKCQGQTLTVRPKHAAW